MDDVDEAANEMVGIELSLSELESYRDHLAPDEYTFFEGILEK